MQDGIEVTGINRSVSETLEVEPLREENKSGPENPGFDRKVCG